MGEPLANPRVFEALKLLMDRRAFGLSARRLNVSTSGILPGIKRLNEQHPQVGQGFFGSRTTRKQKATLYGAHLHSRHLSFHTCTAGPRDALVSELKIIQVRSVDALFTGVLAASYVRRSI